ncbi:YqaE/Pmp3 family membrane protein [Bacillus sp. BGMRC 2118]|nr:YqaE/Pmp3 family membrane protein [Bacillus sp. BGMRC 2118]
MLYLLAILLPPVAVLFVGRPFQALFNLILCLFFYIPGAIHAVLVVHDKKADNRLKKQAHMMAQFKQNK